jgi:hypothetical protein
MKSGCFFEQRRRATRVQPCSLCHLKAAAALNCGRSLRVSGIRGDREFESPILHRRVDCELALEGFSSVDPALAGPDLLQHGYATANTASPSSYGGGRRITAGIQFAARRDNLSSTVSPSKS